MVNNRRCTRKIKVGNVEVGGDAPISVQSMTKTDTRNVFLTVNQINSLQKIGCEIVRIAIPDMEAAEKVTGIKEQVEIPIIADIHFDYKLALECIGRNIDGLRLNPGNISSQEKVSLVIKHAKDKNIPIRIGVNAGSLDKNILEKCGGITSDGMVESAMKNIDFCEKLDYNNLKISLKSSDVSLMMEAYRKLAAKVNYPFHIGVTEAGTPLTGAVKSAIGIGLLLNEGLGDTIRVSLTGESEKEVKVAYDILRTLKLRENGVNIISCPTCGRCELNLQDLALEAERRLEIIKEPYTVAIMGCVVNGPGEAKEADFGIAGGKGKGVIFAKGEKIKTVKQANLIDELIDEIYKFGNK